MTDAEQRLMRVTEVLAARANAVTRASVSELSHLIGELRESVKEWAEARVALDRDGSGGR